MSTTVRVVPTAEWGHTVARHLLDVVVRALTAQGSAHVVLTGGTSGAAVIAALQQLGSASVDWGQVHIWWGDERFVEVASADRNHSPQIQEWLDAVGVPEQNRYPMPALGVAPWGAEGTAAAKAYACTLADAGNPTFTVVLLGVGPDGHIASLFPSRPELHEHDRDVIAVTNSPKPPPARITLTLPRLNNAHQVWLLGMGEAKTDAVGRAWAQSQTSAATGALPAALVHGIEQTIWWLDPAAAAGIPQPHVP